MKLKIDEVAASLDLPVRTVERWIRQGRIPIRRSGDNCTFRRSVIEKWAGQHNLSFCLPNETMAEPQEFRIENLLSAMKRGGIFNHVGGKDVETALRSAVDLIPVLSPFEKDELYDRLLEREGLTSTGIGNGIAIPHPRTPLSKAVGKPVIATCFLEAPIDFNAVDDKPVFIMFILLSPSTKTHLHLLSRLAFCLRDNAFVAFLKASPGSDALLGRIDEFEKHLDTEDNF